MQFGRECEQTSVPYLASATLSEQTKRHETVSHCKIVNELTVSLAMPAQKHKHVSCSVLRSVQLIDTCLECFPSIFAVIDKTESCRELLDKLNDRAIWLLGVY